MIGRFNENLADIAPDLARFVAGSAYGDIYGRPGLDLRSRETATVSALTTTVSALTTTVSALTTTVSALATMENCTPLLKSHVNVALNAAAPAGRPPRSSCRGVAYVGSPVALNDI